MGILSNTRELKEDVLFRASEPLTGSEFDTKVVNYLNRVYRTLAAGASEFLPEYIEDWWWLRGNGVLNLDPVYKTGTISVVNNSDAIVFTDAPPDSMVDRRLLISGFSDKPVIQGHSAGSVNATLDKPWTGDTLPDTEFQLLRIIYDLDTAVQVILSPMIGFRDIFRINGMSPERLDELYPLAQLTPGFPQAFALESETKIRFSHGGSDEDDFFRIEYRFRPKISDLTDSTSSIPLVPSQWMHLLADMALTYLLIDKNDDRSNAVALAARTGLGAMLKENRRRLAKMDPDVGKIITRPENTLRILRRVLPLPRGSW
jgi:hypothetical protein